MRKIVSFEMTKPLIFLICFLVSLSGLAQITDCEKNLPDLIPYRKGDKWGYCNKEKRIVIVPKFDEVEMFGLAMGKLSNIHLARRARRCF